MCCVSAKNKAKAKTRLVLLVLAFAILMAPASGCKRTTSNHDGKISVVCTIFPQYDWVRQILGAKADDIDLTLLLDNRADLHNYQPSVDDIIKISECDLFICVGGESDEWVDDVLKSAKNKKMTVISLLEELGGAAKEEEILEGMENEDEDGDEADYDEHVWLSLKNAQIFCTVITDALSSLDAGNAREYQDNLADYIDELKSLDNQYRSAVDAASVKTLLFGDRFPFRYLTDDYGLTPFAAFSGCSAETEASFETIIFLANKADELNLKTVMVTESSDQSIAVTIISNTAGKNQQILVLDAMQSVTADDAQNGSTYISVMESNLAVLKEALR